MRHAILRMVLGFCGCPEAAVWAPLLRVAYLPGYVLIVLAFSMAAIPG